MTFNYYYDLAKEFAIYPGKSTESLTNLYYPALGLAGETGEVIEHIKKYYRGDQQNLDLDAIQLELGDVLWYWTELHRRLGLDPALTAEKNIAKLRSRSERDKLKGTGDNR